MRYGLSIDAGGIRGLAALVFLIEFVQDRRQFDPVFNIHTFFDVFTGSSVGGMLSAVLCTNPNLFDADINAIITDVVGSIFTLDSPFILSAVLSNRYTHDGIRNVLLKYAPEMKLGSIASTGKRLVIPVYDITNHAPVVFDSDNILEDHENVTLLDMVLATCSFPGMFPPHQIQSSFYIDGGIVQTNPVLLAASDRTSADVKFLSIGCGVDVSPIVCNQVKSWGLFQWLKHGVVNYMGDPRVTDMIATAILNDRYLRINSQITGIGRMDDVSIQNITRLIKMGKSWYWDNKVDIWEFLGFDTDTQI